MKTVTTFLFIGAFQQQWHGKRRICHSLFSYDLLTTNYSSRVDMASLLASNG